MAAPLPSSTLLLPPHNRELNAAAGALLDLLTQDAIDDLLVACGDQAVRDAVAVLLAALAVACGRRRR